MLDKHLLAINIIQINTNINHNFKLQIVNHWTSIVDQINDFDRKLKL
jgi:hypothetical protein